MSQDSMLSISQRPSSAQGAPGTPALAVLRATLVALVALALAIAVPGQGKGKPPDCDDTSGRFLWGNPATLFICTHVPDPPCSHGGASSGDYQYSSVDDEGQVDASLGPVAYTTGTGEKFPNAHSGIDGIPGGGKKPGPKPPGGGVSNDEEADPCGDTGNDICVPMVCPGCGQVEYCDCGFPSVSLPNAGNLKPTQVPLLGTSGSPGGAHAAITGASGQGWFFYRYHDGAAGQRLPFLEVRAVDGTITRYERYGSLGGRGHFRPVEYVDAYDNITRYEYATQGPFSGRLIRIQYPNGIDEEWNYAPNWIGVGGWDAQTYSGVEVTYKDANAGGAPLSHKSYYLLFYKGTAPGSRPFAGDRLFRVYHGVGRVLDDLGQNDVTHALPPNHILPERHSVYELTYLGSGDLVSTIEFGTADNILTATLSNKDVVVEYTYVLVGTQYRVFRETLPLLGRYHEFAYGLDSDPLRPNRVAWVERTDNLLGKVTRTFDDYMRVEQLVIEPPPGTAGRPRAADPDNGGWVEPTALTYNYEYSGCTVCRTKPSAIVELPSNRRTEFDYDPVSGLLLHERTMNPSGGAALADTEYEWEPCVPTIPYGAYRLKALTNAEGKRWVYSYVSAPRLTPLGRESWGVKHQVVTVTSPTVNLADSTQTVLSTVQTFNTGAPPVDIVTGRQTGLVGQLLTEVDADGASTDYQYNAAGLLIKIIENSGGGDNEVVTELEADRWGTLTKITENATAQAPSVTNFALDSAGKLVSASTIVGGQVLEQRLFHDKWGNLTVLLRKNRTSAGAAPDDFGLTNNRPDVAREWLRDEWHYEGGQLITSLRDRRALDRDETDVEYDAHDALFLREDYVWTPDGNLSSIGHGNGSVSNLTYDGYGTLYKVERLGAGQPTLLVGKYFVNSALEVVREYRGDATTPLATNLVRNAAGFITQIQEPAVASPTGYPWTVDAGTHDFVFDIMGRLTEASAKSGATTVAREKRYYDEVGRGYKTELFDGASPTPGQVFTTVWEGASKAKKTLGPAGRFIERSFDALARVSETRDCTQTNPDKTVFRYLRNTHFLEKATRRNWDPLATPAAYIDRDVEYVRDSLGRVVQLRVGPSVTALVHSFSYYSSGFTESYTDPSGKIEKFLPDARGRLIERFLPGTAPIWNGTAHVDWSLTADRTELVQVDGQGRTTRTVYDFARRPIVVMEPGADVEPTIASPHQQFARLLEYDAASRLTTISGADGVKVTLARDGVGRSIMRSRVPTAPNPLLSAFYGRDEIKRNVLGQILETRSYLGAELGGAAYNAEQFTHDAFGRLHEEKFAYIYANNVTEIESSYSAGDPFRSAIRYRNNLTGDADDLWMQYVPDAVGRVQGMDWKTSDGAAWTTLAAYQHEGGATRRRTTSWGLGHVTPPAPGGFDTTYRYDPYGRMDRLDQSFDAQAFVEFHYDAASNLIKEVYNKQGGGGTRKGDRFAYDEHHRLLKAWLGSDQQHLDAANPDGGIGAFVQKLTYGHDAANNRTTVDDQAGQGGSISTTMYTVQDAAHSQGESNRYDTIDGDVMLYDSRGNTGFDGRFYYVYDACNRLTEVYAVQGSQLQVGGGGGTQASQSSVGGGTGTEPTFTVSDPSALRAARAAILGRVGTQPADLFLRSEDPTFLPTLSEPLSPAAVQFSNTPSTTSPNSGTSTSSTQDSFTLELLAVYLYDTLNRRVVRMVTEQPTRYYAWDGWQEVQELVFGADGSNPVARPEGQFVWGERLDELVSYRTKVSGSWANYYVAEGGAHCPSRVLDSGGTVVEIQEYDPYGKATFWVGGATGETSSQGNPFGWKGHRIDQETGLVYMRHRYYTPAWGRFLTQDPLGVWADVAAFGNNYQYGALNPLSREDRSGLQVALPGLTGTMVSFVDGSGSDTLSDSDKIIAMAENWMPDPTRVDVTHYFVDTGPPPGTQAEFAAYRLAWGEFAAQSWAMKAYRERVQEEYRLQLMLIILGAAGEAAAVPVGALSAGPITGLRGGVRGGSLGGGRPSTTGGTANGRGGGYNGPVEPAPPPAIRLPTPTTGAPKVCAENLAEQMALKAAQAGSGRRIMQGKVGDPKYPEATWAKMELVVKTSDQTITIHYWTNVETGAMEGFKFK